jgi:alpha-L-fucosidase
MTINKTWAYNANDREYKSAEFLVRSLVEVASLGGNFPLNVGPQPDRFVQPEFQQRLRAIGDWLAVNGESIYGTTYGPVQNMKSVRTTAKRGRLFLHIFDWPSSPLEISGLDTKVMSANMLAGGQSLKFRQTERLLQIDLPQSPPDLNVTVVAVRTL